MKVRVGGISSSPDRDAAQAHHSPSDWCNQVAIVSCVVERMSKQPSLKNNCITIDCLIAY